MPDAHSAHLSPSTQVTREEVARYYLASEIRNIVGGEQPAIREDLTPKEMWRLLEALSFTYRINSVFHLLSDKAFDWYKVTLPVTAITLTGMTLTLNKIIYSKDINRDPIKLRDYLHKYFTGHPHDDPKGLNECRPRPVPPQFSTIIVREDRGVIKMLDGSHRFLGLLQQDTRQVTAYYAKSNKRAHRPMAGDAVFVTMRQLFTKARTAEEKEAVLETVRLLARKSCDGKSALKTYWIAHTKDKEVQAAARQILGGGLRA